MKLWGVIVIGFVLGLVGGLIVTWFVLPLEYYDTYPPMLDGPYRRDWIHMTAWTYGAQGDWDRTQTRLLNLDAGEVRGTVGDVLDSAIAEGQSVEFLQRIAELAATYGADSPGVAIYAQGGSPLPVPEPTSPQSMPTVTAMPVVSQTPVTRPSTPTPTMTPAVSISDTVPIGIISQTLSCESVPLVAVSLTLSRTVEVRGREQQEIVGMPMREVWLLWNDGADRAITGFRPELGLGYADFVVEPGLSYNLYVDNPYGIPILTFQVEPCPPGEGSGWVSRYLTLREESDAELAVTSSETTTVPSVFELTVVPTVTIGLTPTLPVTITSTRAATDTVTPP